MFLGDQEGNRKENLQYSSYQSINRTSLLLRASSIKCQIYVLILKRFMWKIIFNQSLCEEYGEVKLLPFYLFFIFFINASSNNLATPQKEILVDCPLVLCHVSFSFLWWDLLFWDRPGINWCGGMLFSSLVTFCVIIRTGLSLLFHMGHY